MAYIILLNKPFNCLSQFTDAESRTTLKDFIKNKPGFHVAGRLDYDSEGLLLLTDNGALQHHITDPKHKLAKTYWVQVEGQISDKALDQLRQGLTLKDGLTRPAKATRLQDGIEEQLWPRTPPIRQRQHIPTSWIELTIKEGRNRQVRRMTAATGFPTLRLIRRAIGNWHVDEPSPGQYKEIEVETPQVKKKYKRSHLNRGAKHTPTAKKNPTKNKGPRTQKTRRQSSSRYN